MSIAAIRIDLDRAIKARKDFGGVLAFASGPVMEHHAGRRRASPFAAGLPEAG